MPERNLKITFYTSYSYGKASAAVAVAATASGRRTISPVQDQDDVEDGAVDDTDDVWSNLVNHPP